MKERPILFSGPMVRAILDGRKTQTRRVVKPQPVGRQRVIEGLAHVTHGMNPADDGALWYVGDCISAGVEIRCPFGSPGDRLWVRETLRWSHNEGQCTHGIQHPPEPSDLLYDANNEYVEVGTEEQWSALPARSERIPSIHMPRWASRLTLEVVSVRVERLQEISDLDLLAEGWPAAAEVARGCEGPEAFPFQGVTRGDLLRGGVENPDTAIEWFAEEWDSMNGNGAWGKNPWVWVVEFKRSEKTS